MSLTRFIGYSLSLSAAIFLISVPIAFFPDNKSVLLSFLSAMGYVTLIVSMLIDRGKVNDFGSEPVDIKRFLILLGIVVYVAIATRYYKLMEAPIVRFGVFAVFILLWILLLKNAWKKYKAVDT